MCGSNVNRPITPAAGRWVTRVPGKTGLGVLAALLLVLSSTPAWAQQAGIIQGLQMPAWIDREGATKPLRPGMRIRDGDRLRTGPGARILLILDEGSFVKLGENAVLLSRDIIPATSSSDVFSGFLDVVKGAFRFTTTLLSKKRRRNLKIRIASITATVQGTDVWGKAADNEDILCLIGGDIGVRREGQEAFRMNQPLSFYIAPKGAAAKPVAPVDPEQLKRWAAQVEMTINDGALTGNGTWNLILMSLRERSLALRAERTLQAAGYPVVIQKVTLRGVPWYRIVIAGFVSNLGAHKVADDLKNSFGIISPWVPLK